jgi:hypothetical protein
VPLARIFRTLQATEVHFTPEQQAQLALIATKAGTAPERSVTNVVVRYLDEEACFLTAVEKGIAAADRAASLSKRKKWTPALKRCSRRDAHSLDCSSRKKPPFLKLGRAVRPLFCPQKGQLPD